MYWGLNLNLGPLVVVVLYCFYFIISIAVSVALTVIWEEIFEQILLQDGDDGEEWERHEALNDDPSNAERNKERCFEEEMEVVWEKGGSGIVWYTDAQYWKEKEGGNASMHSP